MFPLTHGMPDPFGLAFAAQFLLAVPGSTVGGAFGNTALDLLG